MALRPRLSPKSMASRYGSQALGRLNTAESVITSFSLAGFEVAFAFPLLERFSGLGLQLGSRGSGITGMAGFAAPESVITSLAGFGSHRPQPLGGRPAIPAAFRYAPAVSRRIPVACWMRRSDQPSRPRAKTCCFFSSFKTLAMPTESTSLRGIQCPGRLLSLAGFQVIISGRFWVIAEVLVAEALAPQEQYLRTTPIQRSEHGSYPVLLGVDSIQVLRGGRRLADEAEKALESAPAGLAS